MATRTSRAVIALVAMALGAHGAQRRIVLSDGGCDIAYKCCQFKDDTEAPVCVAKASIRHGGFWPAWTKFWNIKEYACALFWLPSQNRDEVRHQWATSQDCRSSSKHYGRNSVNTFHEDDHTPFHEVLSPEEEERERKADEERKAVEEEMRKAAETDKKRKDLVKLIMAVEKLVEAWDDKLRDLQDEVRHFWADFGQMHYPSLSETADYLPKAIEAVETNVKLGRDGVQKLMQLLYVPYPNWEESMHVAAVVLERYTMDGKKLEASCNVVLNRMRRVREAVREAAADRERQRARAA